MKNTLMDYDYIMQSYLAVHIPGERLEVIFNSRLSIDAHISDKVIKASKILGLIRTITILNQVTLEQLHKAFQRPHLEFSKCVWSSSLKKYMERDRETQIFKIW